MRAWMLQCEYQNIAKEWGDTEMVYAPLMKDIPEDGDEVFLWCFLDGSSLRGVVASGTVRGGLRPRRADERTPKVQGDASMVLEIVQMKWCRNFELLPQATITAAPCFRNSPLDEGFDRRGLRQIRLVTDAQQARVRELWKDHVSTWPHGR